MAQPNLLRRAISEHQWLKSPVISLRPPVKMVPSLLRRLGFNPTGWIQRMTPLRLIARAYTNSSKPITMIAALKITGPTPPPITFNPSVRM